ncbi:MAG: biotin/lipoyl-containing protein, partial [Alphaproteobacteria bacterium]|nr:biotin/lipoyl-containing protein [Alphaproteobacteria bacterium]
MTISIKMPALSPTMEEGTLARWLVKEGDEVETGDVVAEIETDKATMEVETIDDGKVGKLLVDEGTEGVKVNTVIAVLLEEGEGEGDIDTEEIKAQNKKAEEEAAASEDEDDGEDEAPEPEQQKSK